MTKEEFNWLEIQYKPKSDLRIFLESGLIVLICLEWAWIISQLIK